jgi:hypothetical protein
MNPKTETAAFENIPLEDYVRRDGDFPAGKMTKRQKDQFHLELGRAFLLGLWLQESGYFRPNCGVTNTPTHGAKIE